ncbi:MAG TPA: hypothetical protein PKA82_03665 [Pyrinomonadaceae bacterium]|nr:hypothetical protein [Pyrinomonadaceae bacterium]
MTNGASKTFLTAILIGVAGFVVAAFSGNALQSRRPALPPGYEDSDLAVHGSRMKGFALGFEGLLADWYWVKSLQYIGDKMVAADSAGKDVNLDDLRDLDPRLLYPYIENATDLDPRFIAAYSYGAVVLPAIDPEKAIAITQKGIANNPNEWRLYHQLGYIYWKLKQYDEAAKMYEQGSKIAGAPPFMKMMAAAVKTEGSSRETARQIYGQMLAEAQDDKTKIVGERRLAQLDSEDERDAIDKALADTKERIGRCVNDLREVNNLLMSVKLPNGREFRADGSGRIVDPSNVPYILDKRECKAKLDFERSGVTGR